MANWEEDAPNGEVVSCQSMVFVSKSVSGLFVSFDTLIRLRIVDTKFPNIGSYQEGNKLATSTKAIVGSIRSINYGCTGEPCKFPQRLHILFVQNHYLSNRFPRTMNGWSSSCWTILLRRHSTHAHIVLDKKWLGHQQKSIWNLMLSREYATYLHQSHYTGRSVWSRIYVEM